MEKVINRLKELYVSREKLEKSLVVGLRYSTDMDKINDKLVYLAEYRGRIEELEWILNPETISQIKTELGISFD